MRIRVREGSIQGGGGGLGEAHVPDEAHHRWDHEGGAFGELVAFFVYEC